MKCAYYRVVIVVCLFILLMLAFSLVKHIEEWWLMAVPNLAYGCNFIAGLTGPEYHV